MGRIIIGDFAQQSDLIPLFPQEGNCLYLGATIDLCRQTRTELVGKTKAQLSYYTFPALAKSGRGLRLLSSLEQEALLIRLGAELPLVNQLAEFPGFWQEVMRIAAELAQGGAGSEVLLELAGQLPPLAGEVTTLIASYWQYLEENKLQDPELALKDAAKSLEGKSWNHLFVDGFTDFTPLQEEVLKVLVQNSGEVCIQLQGTSAQDARSLALRLGGDFTIEEALEPAEFPRAQEVQVLAASSQKQEVEEACRWLKQQMRAGYAPSDLVLIAREPGRYRNRVAKTLAKMEIPSEVTITVNDLELPQVGVVAAVLTLIEKDWPQRDLIRIVGELLGTEIAFILDRLSKEANLISGQERWQELVEKNPLGERGPAIRALFAELVALGEPQKLTEFADGFWALVRSRFLLAAPGPAAFAQTRGLARLKQILGELAELSTFYPETVEPKFFQELFLKAAQGKSEQLSSRRHQRGTGVRLLDPVGARGLSWRGAVVLGLEEGVYPFAWAEDWLFTEEIRQSFNRRGIALNTQKKLAARERDFFRLALGSAREQLLLTYKNLDEGAPTLPSPYLVELQQEKNYPEELIPLSRQFPEKASQVASLGELGFLAQGGGELWQEYQRRSPSLARQVSWGRQVVQLRNGKSWSPFDGLLGAPSLQRSLAAGRKTTWSASDLETYINCPFRFFCHRELRLQKPLELEPELTPLELGTVLHEVLAEFYQGKIGVGLVADKEEQYREELTALLAARWQQEEQEEDLFSELQKKRAESQLFLFLEKELKRSAESPLLPVFVEVSFGMGEGLLPEPVVVNLGKRKIEIRGRIDRIDLSPTGEYLVLDYKLSYIPKPEELKKGLNLQLPFYFWAAEKLLPEDTAMQAALFYSLGKGSFGGFWLRDQAKELGLRRQKEHSFEDEAWQELWESYKPLVVRNLERMERGDFRLLPESCPPFCDYQTICRYQKWRIERKGGREDD